MRSDNKGSVAWFVSHPVASKLLLFTLLLAGFSGMTSLPQEVFPPFAPNQIALSMELRGAAPEEVEHQVIRPIEQALAGLGGIDRVIARASREQADVTIELNADVDSDRMLNLVKSRIDAIGSFPLHAEQPILSVPEATEPVMWVSLYGQLPLRALYDQALVLEKELSSLPGVSYAAIRNPPQLQVDVSASPRALQAHGLGLADLAAAIDNHSLNLSAGEIETLDGRLSLRSSQLALNAASFEAIVLQRWSDGRQLLLSDMAQVAVAPVDDYSLSRFNGLPALQLVVRRDSSASLADISNRVQAFVDDYGRGLGDKLQLAVWKDESREFTSRASLLLDNGITGFLLIGVVLGTFIHWRVAFWTAMGIPVSLLGAMALLHYSGLDISLNAMTLFGFLIAAGLIVDDALVIGESVHASTRRSGHTLNSVVSGAQKVAMPATFGALTTIAAFFPLTLTEGDMGSNLGSIGWVVIACLIASVVESKWILPAHLRSPNERLTATLANTCGPLLAVFVAYQRWAQAGFERFKQYYLRLLNSALDYPKRVIIGAALLFATSLTLLFGGWVSISMIPNIADYEVGATFTLDANLSRDQRDHIASRLQHSLLATNKQLRQRYQLEYEPISRRSIDTSADAIEFTVELVNDETAPYDAHEVAALWRQQLPALMGVSAVAIASGPGSDEQVAIELSSDRLADLHSASAQLQAYLAELPGVVDIRDSNSVQSQDLMLTVTAQGQALGVDQRWLTEQLRGVYYGVEAQRVQHGDQEWRVMVRYPQAQRRSAEQLLDRQILTPGGAYTALGNVAELRPARGDTSIQRIDSRRTVTVYANTLTGWDPAAVTAQLEAERLPQLLVDYVGLNYSVEGEAREVATSLSSLLSATLLALFVIFALMALPMQSLRYPVLIFSLLPLGLIGAIFVHWLLDLPLSLMSVFGLIGLSGVLINNGLLLVDGYRQTHKQSVKDALYAVCQDRFRPVILTSITTSVGVMPLLWESDPEALWLVPIAASLGGGVLFGSLLTLLVLPALLLLVDKRREAIAVQS